MKFNFKIQQYQTDAVDSVVNCFNGQPYIDNVSYRRDIGNVRQMKDMSQIDLKFDSEQNAFGLTDDFDESVFNSSEKQNIETMAKIENERGSQFIS